MLEVTRASAIIEGVLMASPRWRVAAVRLQDGAVGVASARAGHGLASSIPFVRGVILNFVAATPELEWSAEDPLPESLPPPAFANPLPALAIHAAAHGLPILVLWPLVEAMPPSSAGYQVAMGIVQVAFYVAYFVGVRRFADLQRIFGYGGAFKRALWLVRDPDAELANLPSWHWRGAPIVMTLAYALVAVATTIVVPRLHVEGRLAIFLVRMALTLPAFGVADELARLLTHLGHGPIVRMLAAPLIAIDRVATSEPAPDQLEVATIAIGRLAQLEVDDG